MKEPTYVITYDVGTTGVKTCLFEIGEVVRLTAAAMRGYELYVLPDGGAEQEPAEWWEAMCASTREVLDASGMDPTRISGVSFCSQMQGVVLVDKDGEPVRRAMSYMDQRAREELKKGLAHGPQIAGANVFKLLKSLQITGAVAASVKDPVWKYKWVQAHEPENFKRVHKWLDVKEFLICKMTGEFVMTQDSAFAALIYDIRKGKEGWSREMCDMLGVNMNHLAPIKQSTDKVGEITEKAASELGLKAGHRRVRRRRGRFPHRRGGRLHRIGRYAYLLRHKRLGLHRGRQKHCGCFRHGCGDRGRAAGAVQLFRRVGNGGQVP